MKKMNFDLTIASNALLCPNPETWYSRAYLSPEDANNYRVIPGVKTSTKVANVSFPSVLKAETCDFSASASALSATTLSICAVQFQVEICKKTIESSFVSKEMAKGSSNWNDITAFMGHYWDALSAEVAEEIEYIRWQGNTDTSSGSTGSGYTGTTAFKALCDGYEKLLAADSSVVDVTLTAITTSNVIAAMEAVLLAAPASIKSTKKSDVRLYVASNVFLAFQIAASKGNTMAYITELLGANFGGIKVVEAPGMSNNKMVFTRVANLVYLIDGENDATDLKAIDLSDTTAQPLLRTAGYIKIGFAIFNPSEIVYYN